MTRNSDQAHPGRSDGPVSQSAGFLTASDHAMSPFVHRACSIRRELASLRATCLLPLSQSYFLLT